METFFPYIFIVIIFALYISLNMEISKLSQKIKDQQKQLDKLYHLTGQEEIFDNKVNLSQETKLHILELVHSGKKIQAIKEVREATNSSLVDAKNYVDKL